MNKMTQPIWVTVVTGLLSVNVHATPPSNVTFEVFDDFRVLQCDNFWVRVASPTKINAKTFFDSDGNPIELRFRLNVLGAEFYNEDDPTISVSQNRGNDGVGENVTFRFDLTTGEEHHTGAEFRLTLPGIGRVLMNTGSIKVDQDGNVMVAGQAFFVAEGESGPLLCEVLAP